MRVYTRTGDDGTTALVGGQRVSKADSRVEAYGAVDELNALLGVITASPGSERLQRVLGEVQDDLFYIGAELATPGAAGEEATTRLRGERASELERVIDDLDGELPALRQFVLPGGSKPAALLHLARTVARRAERRVIALGANEVRAEVLRYLNRLSDLLFVMARWQNQADGCAEIRWEASHNG